MDTAFPTPWGTLDECLTDSSTIFRLIDFTHGFVDIPPFPGPPVRGDVNANGIGFEIADAVLFENYFWYGLWVLNVNLEDQITASEVNGDGVPLTLQDLVYMYYYIWGGPDVPHHRPASTMHTPPQGGSGVLRIRWPCRRLGQRSRLSHEP